ncbi:MAG: hypothetical protein NTY19_20000 [Planctomycetota bacterium]|nr:hypothetical protein [Planctomycetota bacterium]
MMMRRTISCVGALALVWAAAGGCAAALGETYLVQDGQPRADIVISAQPARMVKLAAAELQDYLLKISGAKLPIATAPGEDYASHIHVGRSPHTDRLNVTDAGLLHGAFRIVCAGHELVLLGHDSDYQPPPSYFRGGGERNVPAYFQEWDADVAERASRRGVNLQGERWNPHLWYLWKEYSAKLGVWEKDERGSLNAVYAFLEELGVRWYLPGELGEIVPRRTTIELARVDKTVRPDFALRYPYQYGRNFACNQPDEILWQIPFKTLGVEPPAPETAWRANIGRVHVAAANRIERSLWSAPASTKAIDDRNAFGELNLAEDM